MKDLEKIAWRNLWRNKKRTAITSASIFFAVFFAVIMQSFQKGAWNGFLNDLVQKIKNFSYNKLQTSLTLWTKEQLEQSLKSIQLHTKGL